MSWRWLSSHRCLLTSLKMVVWCSVFTESQRLREVFSVLKWEWSEFRNVERCQGSGTVCHRRFCLCACGWLISYDFYPLACWLSLASAFFLEAEGVCRARSKWCCLFVRRMNVIGDKPLTMRFLLFAKVCDVNIRDLSPPVCLESVFICLLSFLFCTCVCATEIALILRTLCCGISSMAAVLSWKARLNGNCLLVTFNWHVFLILKVLISLCVCFTAHLLGGNDSTWVVYF